VIYSIVKFTVNSGHADELCQPVRTLRSSTSALLVIPFVRSDFASDAFSVSAPPSGTISLRMFDHALTRPLSNRD